ncbi:MAG: hypothetical protein OFPII_26280 [Osedax symbiont Rs1]|nr:MAG: hypothetical protein OFPII_26280 [Osedax symbiont Rs1]
MSLISNKSEIPLTKLMSGKTMTRQLISVEKQTYLLADQIAAFYSLEIDKKFIQSTNLDSKILLQTKRDAVSTVIKELRAEKKELDQLIKPHQQANREILDKIINILINTKNTRRHFEIILGTILLNYPIDRSDAKFSSRLEMSKVLRPMYQTALISLLLEKLLNEGFKFNSEYLAVLLKAYSADDPEAKTKALFELQKIFVEIIYLKEMGFYSPTSLEILSRSGENNLLDELNRKELLEQSSLSGKEFHHYGVGALEVDIGGLDSKDVEGVSKREKTDKKEIKSELSTTERMALMESAARFTFIKDIMDPKVKTDPQIDELLQICKVYSSFMLPVKTKVDKELHIKAYDMLRQQAVDKRLNPLYTQTLLAMMGRFPIGSGVYFIDSQRHGGTIDKALVVGLNPRNPDEPIVKRVTTNYRNMIDSVSGVVAKNINLFFVQARGDENFTRQLKIRFNTQFKNEEDGLLFSFRANDSFRTLAISESKLW